MKQPLPRILSAVPQTLHTQFEIAKAIHTLAGPDENDMQQRRAEIAALRRDCELLKHDLEKITGEWLTLQKVGLRSYLKKYSPDQPRMPAGRAGGGQWISGGELGADNSSPVTLARPVTAADEASAPRQRYAALDTGTQNDATASTAATVDQVPPDGPGRPSPRISAHDIPANSPKHPVPLVDSSGHPITDDRGNPLLRPDDKPPEMFVREGLAARGAMRNGADALAVAMVVARASLFAQGGPWDAQRVDGQFVDEYRDYATIAIGLYMAAAGVPLQIALLAQDIYARKHSTFDRNEPMDWLYRDLPTRNIRNTEIGYELYRSGRVTAGR